jgi:Rps23 Pro-64 3,4-dihydroxylase Tpa1-like proline 4-hydroxylase
MSILGDWVSSIDKYSNEFKNAKPFEHVVIPGFLKDELAQELVRIFPRPLETSQKLHWHFYDNPLERKYALNDFSDSTLEPFRVVFDFLQSDEMVSIVRRLTGIENLECDPFLHGAGLHAYPNNGKLDMHLDYSIHPKTGKERRVNIIYYLNQDWNPEWGGQLHLRDSSLSAESEKKVEVGFNSAAVFRTCDDSFHGLPTPIRCGEGRYRQSLAIYYVSDARPEATPRYKAQYFPLPGQPVSDALKKIYDIRATRLLTPEDLSGPAWEDWRNRGNGYW